MYLPLHKSISMKNLYLSLLLASFFCLQCTQKEDEFEKKLPNILLIISDDQGWTDYSFMGHPHIETPSIDRLAAESLTFTRGYVAAPLCRSSLATLATGLYPHQHGVTGNDPAFDFEGPRYRDEWREKRIPLNEEIMSRFYQRPNLPKMLGELGYLSLQTGKWWEGSWQRGGFTSGMTHGVPAQGGRHGDDGLKIGREGMQTIYDFIDTARQNDRPFFIWHAPFLPHAPHTPPEELEEKYLAKAPTPAIARYWAMCEWFDQTCGELLDHLEEKQLTENTLVIYVCDNGWIQLPDAPNRFAPRSKQSPYEMGVRTPIMYKWPGKITPAMDTTTLASSTDIVPTILAACGLEATSDMQGLNALQTSALKERDYIFAEAYNHDVADVKAPTRSLKYRVALNYHWKLIVPDTSNLPDAPIKLFKISEDPHEQNNLADNQADRVEQMAKVLNEWWTPLYEN